MSIISSSIMHAMLAKFWHGVQGRRQDSRIKGAKHANFHLGGGAKRLISTKKSVKITLSCKILPAVPWHRGGHGPCWSPLAPSLMAWQFYKSSHLHGKILELSPDLILHVELSPDLILEEPVVLVELSRDCKAKFWYGVDNTMPLHRMTR
jgi:hypothetical protein